LFHFLKIEEKTHSKLESQPLNQNVNKGSILLSSKQSKK